MPDPSLPDSETDAIFASRILPKLGVTEGGVARPRWIFIGGQQGSGKSTVRRHLADELDLSRTQLISGDDFSLAAPEQAALSKRSDAARAEWRRLRMDWTERLIERAWTLKAHVIWEQPVPNYVMEFGAIARELGYQVECQVLALPLLESWLAAARRNLAPDDPDKAMPPIAWSDMAEAYHRWPAFLAAVEARRAFDRIMVLDRAGQVHFENSLRADATGETGTPAWESPAFAFESLVVERNQPRSPGDIAALLAAGAALEADPRLAAEGRFAASRDSMHQLEIALQALQSDPGAGFDLNQPDPALAPHWIARLKAELQATQASREGRGQKGLAARCDRLLALVAEMTGQPIR